MSNPDRKRPDERPDILQVHPLTNPAELIKRKGRRKKISIPALPEEIYQGMSPLEKEHFDFFIEAFELELTDMTPVEMICIRMGALDYINTLRLQVDQLKSGQLVTMSRQHPAVQLRAWIQAALSQRKGKPGISAEQEERINLKSALLGLSS